MLFAVRKYFFTFFHCACGLRENRNLLLRNTKGVHEVFCKFGFIHHRIERLYLRRIITSGGDKSLVGEMLIHFCCVEPSVITIASQHKTYFAWLQFITGNKVVPNTAQYGIPKEEQDKQTAG